MNIVVMGAGRIGSVFAFHLARAGHSVTVVARGSRLVALQRDGAIITTEGHRAVVRAVAALDPAEPFELALVTAPEHQVQPLVQQLAASAARTVLLMFNSFAGLAPYRAMLGASRVTAGFPKMIAFLDEQRLRFKVNGPGMVTTLERPELAVLMKSAGLPSEVQPDMDAFLRSHVAMVVPTFIAALWTWQRDYGLTWDEARRLAPAWSEGLALVRHLGHPLLPRALVLAECLPRAVLAALLWAAARTAAVRDLGAFGPTETRSLIDSMVAATPGGAQLLLALRP